MRKHLIIFIKSFICIMCSRYLETNCTVCCVNRKAAEHFNKLRIICF